MKNVRILGFVFGILVLALSGNAYAQEKDMSAAAKKCYIASKVKGELQGYYLKPAGVMNAAKINNPRYAVTSKDVTLVGATVKGTELWIELSIDEDAQGIQFLALGGITQVGYTPAGGKLEVTKLDAKEKTETLNFDKGKVVLYFANYKDLETVPAKK